MSLSWDWETKGVINLKTAGVYVYAAHPQTEALLASYKLTCASKSAFNIPAPEEAWLKAGGEIDVIYRWRRGEPCPKWVRAYIEAGGELVAFNANFEIRIWNDIMVPRHGWPVLAVTQCRCTMATAAALGLPRSLERLGEALDLPIKKDKRGTALMKIHSIPQKIVDGEAVWHPLADDAASLEDYAAYCDADVLAEEGAATRMVPLSDDEMAVWHLDQKINARGVRYDRRSAVAAIALVEKATLLLDAEMAEITGGAVTACSQVAKLTAWCAEQGVSLEGVAKDDILDALDLVDLPDRVRRALLCRQEGGKSSTSKLKAFIKHANDDDRIRGMFVYHNTGPGRWSSAGGVNLNNMPRPRPAFQSLYEDGLLDAATLFEAIRTEEPAVLKACYGDDLGRPLHLVSDAIRGFLIAAPSHDFIAVDYSSIQGVIAAWLAQEEWKLEAMRGILTDPTLPDLYRRAAAGILNTTTDVITKKHPMRQAVGKTSELSLQFAGGCVALIKMAKNYSMKLSDFHDLYPAIWGAASPEMREKAAKRYERCVKGRDKVMTDIMTRESWLTCELIKLGWRATNPAIVELWSALENAMREAIRNPGVAQRVSKVTYLLTRGALWCRLPSGRCVCYNAPKLRDQVWAKLLLDDGSWTEAEVCDREEAHTLEQRGKAKIQGATSPKVTALGVNSQTQKMERYALYGGLALENLCLGIERDILVCGMRNVERAGYPIVLHVYDEAVAEVPHGFGSVEEMERLMLDLPAIYADLPLAAHGWKSKRYHK